MNSNWGIGFDRTTTFKTEMYKTEFLHLMNCCDYLSIIKLFQHQGEFLLILVVKNIIN